MSTQKDGGLVPYILEHAPKFGLHLWRQNSGGVMIRGVAFRGAPAGTPDIVGYSPLGRFIGIECKAPKATTKKETREAQIAFAVRTNDTLLGRCYLVSSRDEALETLAHIRWDDEMLESFFPKEGSLFRWKKP